MFAAASGLRAWALADLRAGDPLFRTAILDDAYYLQFANDLRSGAFGDRPWFLAPLYPYTLAALSHGAPPTMALAGWFSALAGASCAAVTALAARTLHSSLAGWIGGTLVAVSGVLIFQDVLPGQEPLLCLLHAAALLAVAAYVKRGAPPGLAVAAGAIAGLAMLGRATSAVLVAAFAVTVLLHVTPRRRAWLHIALAAVAAVVVMLPAAWRNAMSTGELTPFPWSGGPNLFMANGPSSRKHLSFTAPEMGMDPGRMESAAALAAEADAGRKLNPSEASSYWTRRTWDERGSAGELAAHLGKKALFFWTSVEAGSTHEIAVERRWSKCLSVLPVTSWWMLAAGAAGWWIARRRVPALDFAALTIVLTWAALTVFFPLSRYRAPVLPLAAAAAAAGVAELMLSGTTQRRGLAAALIFAAAFVVSRLELRAPIHARGWNNLATAFEAEGDKASAYDMLRRGAEEEPGDGPVHEHWGRLLIEDGQPAAALEQFRLAKDDERTKLTAGVPAVLALVLLHRPEDAELAGWALLDRPLPGDRFKAEVLAYLALAAHARGDLSGAEFRLASARKLAPDHPAVVRIGKMLAM